MKLIKYEFKVDTLLGIDPREMTIPKIKQYLKTLENLMLDRKVSDASLFHSEFMLAALTSIYRNTRKAGMYQALLLDYLSGIIDETAQFIESTQNGSTDQEFILLKESKFSRLKREIDSCLEALYSLLEERIR